LLKFIETADDAHHVIFGGKGKENENEEQFGLVSRH